MARRSALSYDSISGVWASWQIGADTIAEVWSHIDAETGSEPMTDVRRAMVYGVPVMLGDMSDGEIAILVLGATDARTTEAADAVKASLADLGDEATLDNLIEVLTNYGAEDLCRFCGGHVGWGDPSLHINLCDDARCRRRERDRLNRRALAAAQHAVTRQQIEAAFVVLLEIGPRAADIAVIERLGGTREVLADYLWDHWMGEAGSERGRSRIARSVHGLLDALQ